MSHTHTKNLAVELLTKLLKEQLRKQGAHNVVQSDKFSTKQAAIQSACFFVI